MGERKRMGKGGEEWKASGFGCFSNIKNCMLGWCCPCVLYGQTNDILEEHTCMSAGAVFCCLPWCTICCYAPGRRGKMRETLNLPESPCNDCLWWICCPHCANCQEANELKERNITDYKTWANTVEAKKNDASKAAA